ncbi:MAG: hypothetical protein MJZ29_06950 [Bacteroidaceae bacterium]|nr:hypothetical protein [Bacteroidaceae bacterium]
MSKNECITRLSPHLFWDVDVNSIEFDKHKAYIVQRVMEYGLMEDWNKLKETIGITEIVETCKRLRTLDPKALAFISLISKTPLEEFRCYTTKQLNQTPWDF